MTLQDRNPGYKNEKPCDQTNPVQKPFCHLVIGPTTIKWEDRKTRNYRTRIYLSQNGGMPANNEFRVFRTENSLQYLAFYDDFGPMNAHAIMHFVELLESEINTRGDSPQSIVYVAEDGPRAFTNAAFLLGAYMILKLNQKASDVWERFRGLNPKLFEGYRDASNSQPTFRLELVDCWKGLEKGKEKGWISLPTSECGGLWGMVDKESYKHYDNLFNADLHEVVPKKLILFRGPKDHKGRLYRDVLGADKSFLFREFAPEYYADILNGFQVETVVRLNDPQYNSAAFLKHGIRLCELQGDEGSSSPPPPAVISRFFKIMDTATGTVAMHGLASLGQAGTLAALYLMRSQGFTAREAIGWVRIMRPGSIIGCQQQYLCSVEESVLLAAAGMAIVVDPTNNRDLFPATTQALDMDVICKEIAAGDHICTAKMHGCHRADASSAPERPHTRQAPVVGMPSVRMERTNSLTILEHSLRNFEAALVGGVVQSSTVAENPPNNHPNDDKAAPSTALPPLCARTTAAAAVVAALFIAGAVHRSARIASEGHSMASAVEMSLPASHQYVSVPEPHHSAQAWSSAPPSAGQPSGPADLPLTRQPTGWQTGAENCVRDHSFIRMKEAPKMRSRQAVK